MHLEFIEACLIILSACGGIAGIIAADGWAKAEQRRAEGKAPRTDHDPILAELTALKSQMREMQETGHQFDLSFDSTLSSLTERVSRLETRAATGAAQTSETHLQNIR